MGEGREFAISFDGIFLTYMSQTYSPHTDISHVAGHLACSLLFVHKNCFLNMVLVRSREIF